MTTFGQFDPFEHRISSALEEIAPVRRPDYLDDLLRQTTRTSQRPRWSFPGKWLPISAGRWRTYLMKRPVAIAGAAIVVAIGGVAVLGFRTTPDDGMIGGPSGSPSAPAPSASMTPSPPPTPAPTSTPAATLAVPLRAEWLADVTSIDGLAEHDPRVGLLIGRSGRDVALRTNDFGNTTLSSIPAEATGTELLLVSDAKGAGCEVGDEGRYRWSLSPDGVLLTLEAITDTCATRASAFSRTWTRSLDAHSNGGRGVLAAFDPVALVTLPAAPFDGSSSRDAMTVESFTDGRTLFAMRDPWGLDEPCADGGGSSVPLKPGIDAVVAQLGSVPDLTVASQELVIGGHRALHVSVQASAGADCPTGELALLTSKNVTSGWRWTLAPGESASLYLVELPDAVYLFQYTGAGVTPAEERALVSSISFADSLPPAP